MISKKTYRNMMIISAIATFILVVVSPIGLAKYAILIFIASVLLYVLSYFKEKRKGVQNG